MKIGYHVRSENGLFCLRQKRADGKRRFCFFPKLTRLTLASAKLSIIVLIALNLSFAFSSSFFFLLLQVTVQLGGGSLKKGTFCFFMVILFYKKMYIFPKYKRISFKCACASPGDGEGSP